MAGSRALAGEEPAGVDTQAVGEAQHELGGEVDPALAGLEAPPLGPVRWEISERGSGRFLTEAIAQTAHQAWTRAVRLGLVPLPFAECSFRVLEEQRA